MATSGNANNNYKYNIFLNHRGSDTKDTIASDLYRWLTFFGLQVFLDLWEMKVGEKISTQIKEAIASASLHFAIFSPRYAESVWCLEELRLMFESNKPIIPIFYKVKPADLRLAQEHKGAYAAALKKHENEIAWDGQPLHNSTTVGKWRNALSRAAGLSGLEVFNGNLGEPVFKAVICALKWVEKSRSLQISYEMRYRSGTIPDTVNTIGMHDQPRALKIVLKVELRCMKCQKRTMKGIANVKGVVSIALDIKEMKLTVIGSADPVCLTKTLRKFGFADLLSVGPAQMKFRRSEDKSMLRGRL